MTLARRARSNTRPVRAREAGLEAEPEGNGNELIPPPRPSPSGTSRKQPEKCEPRARTQERSRECLRIPAATARRPDSLYPKAATSRWPPFTTTQFHVLLNSLFKVLFNLPSRYLFAIGLGVIFSLTRSLPRTLGCTPKQPDSREKSAQQDSRLTGLSPSTGHGHCQVGL